jgi:aspartate kinase
MLEAATAGAKVLHNRSVNVGKKNNMPIIVKNAQKRSRGSIVQEICDEDEIEKYSVKFITKKDDISKICIIGDMVMSNKEAIVSIYNVADKENVTIYMISFSELAINIIVDKDKALSFMEKLHEVLIENK